jgi:hypothetical protein
MRGYLSGRVTAGELADVDIVVSEMVTEMLRLRRGNPSRPVIVDAGLVNDRLWLSVVDRGVEPSERASETHPDPLTCTIVDRIATSSGVARGGGTRRLWATFLTRSL